VPSSGGALPPAAEVGYWVHPDARGRGVATAALRVAVRHALLPAEEGGLGLRAVRLQAAADNPASRRVAEKAGLRAGGRLREVERRHDGSTVDRVLFDVVAEELS
jgi:RimJ/RimL family protein N-acetyltransferase